MYRLPSIEGVKSDKSPDMTAGPISSWPGSANATGERLAMSIHSTSDTATLDETLSKPEFILNTPCCYRSHCAQRPILTSMEHRSYMDGRILVTGRLAPFLISVLLLCSPISSMAQSPTSEMTVISTHSHDSSAFTQGLEMHDGFLYESTGLYGHSSLRQVDPISGEVLRIEMLEDDYFGEGITIVNDLIYMLTWKQEKTLVFDLDSFELVANLSYSGEGWGLCFDGTHLVMSNGSSELSFRNPVNFSIISTITVSDGGVEVDLLNELECVGETIYANVWGSDLIVAIDKSSGNVLQTVDASALSLGEPDDSNAVLNGIAYVSDSNAFLLTGKNWSSMHLVSFVSEEQVSEPEADSLIISILGTIWPVLLFAALIIFLSSMRLLGAFMQFFILFFSKRQPEQPRAISNIPPQEAEEQ
ncbi:MAG: hypothetical protein CMA47_01895 [Euryarchaeota archaeon]|nr:hypothetical protein [Euryarchaeota archaeon]